MADISPQQLLRNPAVIAPQAPWCCVLDNLELGVILLAQPWVAGPGLRRADLERQLQELTSHGTLGPLYFQRISRAVAGLEARRVLQGSGAGRERRFVATPEGFAALMLNLHVLHADPTIDGSEFELKRELVALWNLTLDRMMQSAPQITLGEATASFFEQVDRITIWNRPVITPAILKGAFDVLRLIGEQRALVESLRAAKQAQLAETRSQMDLLRTADLSQLDLSALGDRMAALKDQPELLELIRGIATSAAPLLSIESQIVRYESYLTYLEKLERLYAKELKLVDITSLRRRAAGQE